MIEVYRRRKDSPESPWHSNTQCPDWPELDYIQSRYLSHDERTRICPECKKRDTKMFPSQIVLYRRDKVVLSSEWHSSELCPYWPNKDFIEVTLVGADQGERTCRICRGISVLSSATIRLLRASDESQEPVRLYAAGSLRAALTDLTQAFEQQEGVPVVTEFGPSGLLRERIEKGAPAEVFASADMGHPEALLKASQSGPVTLFARNQLCAIASPKVEVTTATLLDVLLDPKVRVGSSTPKNDPSGDYTWTMFEKAEKIRNGSYATLSSKALKLVGGVDAPPPPKDRTVYTMLMQQDKADIFLTYCTSAILASQEAPELRVIQVPQALAVGADYGMTVMKGASAAATKLSQFILSAPVQQILAQHGFAAGRTQ